MERTIKNHKEYITVDNLVQFRSEAFAPMSSSFGRHGSFVLGVNGLGQFVVKTEGEDFIFNNPSDAIEKFVELLPY